MFNWNEQEIEFLKNNYSKLTIKQIAEKLFSDDIIAYFKKNGYHPSIYYYVNDFGTKMYTISLYRKSEKIRFLDYIYKDSNVYLDRKYNRYLKVKE